MGLSQHDLAQAAGVTTGAISHMETGIRKPSADVARRVAGALSCTVDDLLTGAQTQAEPSVYIRRVQYEMKRMPLALQEEVAEYCEFVNRRKRKEER